MATITSSFPIQISDEDTESFLPMSLELGPAAVDFMAGSIGGAASIVAGQPFDTIRVRMQQRSCRHKSMSMVAASIVRKEGPFSFFRGMSYPLYSSALQSAIMFQAYGMTLRHLCPDAEHPSVAVAAVGGMVAGLVQCFVMVPVELVKIRMQLQRAPPTSRQYKGPFQMMRHVVNREGLGGLWRGSMVTLARDLPSFGICFAVYTWACQHLNPLDQFLAPQWRREDGPSPFSHLMAGGMAGVASWLAVYPMDVVKSRLQALPRAPNTNWVNYALTMYRQEGLHVFTRGLTPTLVRAFLLEAVNFAGYEVAAKMLRS